MKDLMSGLTMLFVFTILLKFILEFILLKIGFTFLNEKVSFVVSLLTLIILIFFLTCFNLIKEFLLFLLDILFNRNYLKKLNRKYIDEIKKRQITNKILKEKIDEIFKQETSDI